MNNNDIRMYVIFGVAGAAMLISHFYQKRKHGTVDNRKVMAWLYRVLGAAMLVAFLMLLKNIYDIRHGR